MVRFEIERPTRHSESWVTRNPFRYFIMSPAITQLAVMRCVRFPLSLRNVEDFSTSVASEWRGLWLDRAGRVTSCWSQVRIRLTAPPASLLKPSEFETS